MARNLDITNQDANNVYEFDHYSGAQISIYVGDIWVDDIETISFRVQQARTPLYGYASQYYSRLAAGHVIVQGAFSVAFRESYYIPAVLREYHKKHSAPIYRKNGKQMVLRENIERYLQQKKKSPEDKQKLYNYLLALDDDGFEDIAEEFQDFIWQKENLDNNKFLTYNMEYIDEQTSNDVIFTHRRADQYPPFDIWILYGDLSNKAANNTVRKIVDATITGVQQNISPDGTPIHEVYQFVAKNLI